MTYGNEPMNGGTPANGQQQFSQQQYPQQQFQQAPYGTPQNMGQQQYGQPYAQPQQQPYADGQNPKAYRQGQGFGQPQFNQGGPTMTVDGQMSYSFEKARNTSITKAYGEMTLGLLLTAAVALLGDASGLYAAFTMATGSFGWIALAVIQIGIAIYMGAKLMKISVTTARALFYGYAALTGFTLGSIFYAYSPLTIGVALFMCMALFFVLTMLSLTTKKDMLKAGPILFAALLVLLIGEVILMFVAPSNTVLMITAGIGLVIFAGLTMYDAQQTRQLFAQVQATGDMALMDKISLISAFNLYLDFVNMFLYLLQLFGSSDN